MPSWRDHILQHFRVPIHRLTLVADPDGLLLEEELLTTIRQNGFDLLPFEDPIAFRFAYESRYRQHWDDGQDTDLVVILRSPGVSLRSLPYDLLQSGRTLTFGLNDLFPKLSYPVISDLDRGYLQPLYEAYQRYSGSEMGDRASTVFVLKHVFGIVPELIKSPADLLKLLLSRHARGERVPPRLDALLLESLRRIPELASWPLKELLGNAQDFFAFLQERWPGYLAAQQPAEKLARESGPIYDIGYPLPFDDPDVRVYVDNLFLEGKLKPVSLPEGWIVEDWAQVGVEIDEYAFELRRYAGLLTHLETELPTAETTHRKWMQFAAAWAELTGLHHRLASALNQEAVDRHRTLHLEVEARFAKWMLMRYHTLHSLPFLPMPTMVHHIPDYLAAYRHQHAGCRLALVIVDGLALDQWNLIRDIWTEEALGWPIQESTAFAWVPTLTPISRQAILAGTAPQFFPGSWQTTNQESSHWLRFWRKQGLHPANVGYLRNLGVKALKDDGSLSAEGEVVLEAEVKDLLGNPQIQVAALVVNTVDNIMHGIQLGTAGMHQQVQLWLTHHRYLTQLVTRLLQASFTVYITSDHGNVWARGIGRPKEGILVEKRSQRARVYTEPAFVQLGKEQSPTAVEWTNVGLPAQIHVLLAPQLDAFLNVGEHAVCHGGIALEEVIVPFIEISQETKA
jgi:hypothetical protein